jgi:hypothetical protein
MSAKTLRERAKELSAGATISRVLDWSASNRVRAVLTLLLPQLPAFLAWLGGPSLWTVASWIVAGLIASFVIAQYLAIADALQQLMTEPDYGAWDGHDVLTIAQAGSLWAEVPVTLKGESEQRYAKQTWLKTEAELNRLICLRHPPDIGVPAMGSHVARAELLKLANRIKDRPKFLFKDQRNR